MDNIKSLAIAKERRNVRVPIQSDGSGGHYWIDKSSAEINK